jgi:hypothetical protein
MRGSSNLTAPPFIYFLTINFNRMTEQDEKQLWLEIEHIFDSGANELRVFNMVKFFIEKRYQALHISPIMPSCEGIVCLTGSEAQESRKGSVSVTRQMCTGVIFTVRTRIE